MLEKICPTCQRPNDADVRTCWMCGCTFPSAAPAMSASVADPRTALVRVAAQVAAAAVEAARRQLDGDSGSI